ncbi:MAG: DegT/DnrJ/EryC1/StrS family aminotransferase [Gemmatimonadales bacterium]
MRHQLPVWSPVTLRGLLAGLHPEPGAAARLADRVLSAYRPQGVLLTDSGTSALALALLAAAPKGERPRVALPGYGCFDLMTAADAADSEVLLYDVDPLTLAPAAGEVDRVLRHGARAVVVTHWYGLPVDLDPIRSATKAAGARLIEDAAQAIGVECGGVPAGAQGEFGVLSLGRGKGRTGGRGGVLLANDGAAAAALDGLSRRLASPRGGGRALASLATQWLLGRPWAYGLPASLPFLRLGETPYHPAHSPFRIPERVAAVAAAVWDESEAEIAVRRQWAAEWERAIGHAAGVTLYRPPAGTVAGWLRFPLLAAPGWETVLRTRRLRRRGLMPGYPRPLDELPVSADRLAGERAPLHGARRLARQLFTLPCHRQVSAADVRAVRNRLDPSLANR